MSHATRKRLIRAGIPSSARPTQMMNEVIAPVLVAPRRFEVQKFPTPETDDQTGLVSMLGAGVCGTDKHVYTQGEVRLGLGTDIVRLPIIMGHENLGIVCVTWDEGGADGRDNRNVVTARSALQGPRNRLHCRVFF